MIIDPNEPTQEEVSNIRAFEKAQYDRQIDTYKEVAKQVLIDHSDLQDIKDEYLRLVTAVVIANQIRFNTEGWKQHKSDPSPSIPDPDPSLAVPEAIEIIKKTIPNLLVCKIAAIQPLISPNGYVCHREYNLCHDEPVGNNSIQLIKKTEETVSKTRKYKEFNSNDSLDVDTISKKIIKELNEETIVDLWNNVGTRLEKPRPTIFEELHVMLCEIGSTIHRKTLRKGIQHIVMGRTFYEDHLHIFSAIDSDKTDNGFKYNDWEYHIDNSWTKDGLLVTAHENNWDGSGYYFSPYIMMQRTPQLSPETLAYFCPIRGYMRRYSKKLLRSGAKWYGSIVFN